MHRIDHMHRDVLDWQAVWAPRVGSFGLFPRAWWFSLGSRIARNFCHKLCRNGGRECRSGWVNRSWQVAGCVGICPHCCHYGLNQRGSLETHMSYGVFTRERSPYCTEMKHFQVPEVDTNCFSWRRSLL